MGELERTQEITLLEVVEKLLDKGVVISGELILSCANVDLVYVNVKILITSVQTLLDRNSQRV